MADKSIKYTDVAILVAGVLLGYIFASLLL